MKQVTIFLFILRVTCICIAQNTQPNELHFNRLSIKNGLPEDVINAMLQDKEGYIWISTQAGLVRFDGYKTKVYQFGMEDPNHASVQTIYEDRSGELWIGTWLEGLYHYDRATDTFEYYKHEAKDINSVSEGVITSIHDDRNGNLWIILSGLEGKTTYLNKFEAKTHRFKHFGIHESGHGYINASECLSLCEGRRGQMWVGTNNGIYEYSPGRDTFIPHFATYDSSQQKRFNLLTNDAAYPGIIWMTVFETKSQRGSGLWKYNTDDNSITSYKHISGTSSSLACDSVFSIQKDSHGGMWFGSFTGLSTFVPSTKNFVNYTIKEKQPNPWYNAIFILTEDKAGNFWCGNQNNLLLFDATTKEFMRYRPNEKDPDALRDNGYTNVLIDRSGTLWVGTAFQGLNWLNVKRSRFTVYKNNPGQSHYFPGGGNSSFAEAKDGTFWVWTLQGLYHWYPSTDSFSIIKTIVHKKEDFAWRFGSVVVDKQGVVWCSTFGEGLYSYDPESGHLRNFKNNEKDSSSLSNNQITSLCEDHEGTLWIGTFGSGLCTFNRQTNSFKRYPFITNYVNTPNNNALDDGVIFTIYEDSRGTLWAGTNLGGINKYNKESGTFTSYQNILPGFMTISNIFEDSKGDIWSGTHASGLFMLDRKTNIAKRFTEKDGLLYDGALGINEDNANNLWITSARGISILNLQTNKISTFSTINGLPEDPENNLKLFKTSNGKFLMPCKDGFISFDPGQLKPDTTVPLIHIESIDIAGDQTPGSKQKNSLIYKYGKSEIHLRYNEDRITINYIGLQYQNAALNQYAYKLDGYDRDWIQAATQRSVTYANLSPGRYTFHVKAANSDGLWNTNDDFIVIIVSPPWWLSWWAYCVYALTLVSITYILYRNRINQLNKKQQMQISVMVAAQEGERKRISRDLHDDVGTKLSAVKMFLSSLHEKAIGTGDKEMKSLAESSEQFITQVTQDVRRLLLNLSPAVLEEFGYATAVEGLINKINETKQIHFNLVMFGMKQRLQKDYELALYRITQELINNVLKHAAAKNVSLQIGQRDKKIILMIEDDGKGFEVNANKDGYGLHNLEARTKLMQGTMTIDSTPGKGTSVWIEIPDNFNVA